MNLSPHKDYKMWFSSSNFPLTQQLHSGEENSQIHSSVTFFFLGEEKKTTTNKTWLQLIIYIYIARKAKHNLIFQKIACHTSFTWLGTMLQWTQFGLHPRSWYMFCFQPANNQLFSHVGNFLKVFIILEELAKEKPEWLLAVSEARRENRKRIGFTIRGESIQLLPVWLGKPFHNAEL